MGKLVPAPRYNEVHIDFPRACSKYKKGVAVLVAVVAQEEVEEGEAVVEAGIEVTMEVRRMEDGVEEEIFGEEGIAEVEEEVEIVEEGEEETVVAVVAVEVVETETLLEDTVAFVKPNLT